MKRGTAIVATLAASTCLALPAAAQARPWGGTGANDLGSAYGLFQVNNGRVTISNVQMVMSCHDTGDGTDSDRAFSVTHRGPVTLRRNRLSTHFSAESGGRHGEVRLDGTFGSNGRGYVWMNVDAEGRDIRGGTVERCQGRVRIALRRGPGR